MPYKDPERGRAANRERQRRYYQRNIVTSREVARQKTADQRREARVWLDAIKREEGCIVCGIDDPRVLQLHHLDSASKSFTIAKRMSCGLRAIQREAAKCVVICANDHALYHAGDAATQIRVQLRGTAQSVATGQFLHQVWRNREAQMCLNL